MCFFFFFFFISLFSLGILAADESTGTIGKRFDGISVENNLENRIAYREALFTTNKEEISQYLGGAILYEETLESKGSDGKMLKEHLQERGIIIGIKVDKVIFSLPISLFLSLFMGVLFRVQRSFLEQMERLSLRALMICFLVAKSTTLPERDLPSGEQ